jgi:DNA-binding SARP family transcriptional activator
MWAISDAMRSQSMRFMTEMVEADIAYARGDEAEGTRLLRTGLERARRQRLRFYAGWRPSVMTRLCVAALEREVCVEYVQDLVRHHGLVPDRAPIDIPNWPWAVEIRALGSLRIRRGARELGTTGKAPHRPLELLRVLVALGGRQVPGQRLIDALWPDAEGDAGQQALDTNLLRLRRHLQGGEFLVVEDGRVSLDEGQCWVDVWAVERCLERIEGLFERGAQLPEMARQAQEAIRLCAGPFLADSDQAWAVAPRERLRRRVLGVVERIARMRERGGDPEGALASYLGGLHVDDLAEGLYQGAMRCYVTLDRLAEAAALYERCRCVLGAQLGIEPSSSTRAIITSLGTASSHRTAAN